MRDLLWMARRLALTYTSFPPSEVRSSLALFASSGKLLYSKL